MMVLDGFLGFGVAGKERMQPIIVLSLLIFFGRIEFHDGGIIVEQIHVDHVVFEVADIGILGRIPAFLVTGLEDGSDIIHADGLLTVFDGLEHGQRCLFLNAHGLEVAGISDKLHSAVDPADDRRSASAVGEKYPGALESGQVVLIVNGDSFFNGRAFLHDLSVQIHYGARVVEPLGRRLPVSFVAGDAVKEQSVVVHSSLRIVVAIPEIGNSVFALLRRLEPDFRKRVIEILIVAGQDDIPVGDLQDEAGEHLKRKSQQDKNRKRKNPFSWPEIFHLNLYVVK